MHKIPLTPMEEEGLRVHRLPIGQPSQLADSFRHGVAWALRTAAAPSAPAPAEVPTEEAPTLMKLLRAAWAGDRRIAEAYGTLLADRLDADEPGGRGRYVRQMLEVLRGERPEVFVHAVSSPAPAEVPMPEPMWDSKGPRPYGDSYSKAQLLAYAAAREAAATAELRAENERLKAERDDFHAAYRMTCDEQTKSLHAEVERLRKDADRWRSAVDDYAAGVIQGYDPKTNTHFGYVSRFVEAIQERDAAMRQEPKA